MALGEDVAASLGYRPRSVGIQVVVLSAIAVGACVSVCGAIGFVGLEALALLWQRSPVAAIVACAVLLAALAWFIARQVRRSTPSAE